MTRIRAAVCTAFDAPLQIEELDLRAPGAGEIEVTLEAVAICHSDISYATGAWGGALPAVYGHEAAGRITALGDGISGLQTGDRVVVTLIRACAPAPPAPRAVRPSVSVIATPRPPSPGLMAQR